MTRRRTKECENKERFGSYEADCRHKDRFLGPRVTPCVSVSFVTLLFSFVFLRDESVFELTTKHG